MLNQTGKAATKKLKMLDSVVSHLHKSVTLLIASFSALWSFLFCYLCSCYLFLFVSYSINDMKIFFSAYLDLQGSVYSYELLSTSFRLWLLETFQFCILLASLL